MSQLLGQVISAGKMHKTVKVAVTSLKLHPVILKYWNEKKVFLAHDEKNECSEGDFVLIKQGRKLSKRKSYSVMEVVEKSQQATS